MSSCPLKLSAGYISNMLVIDTAIFKNQSTFIIIVTKKSKVAIASPVFTEFFILPIEIRLHVVFNKLSDIWIPTKFTHQDWKTKSLHISQFSLHCFIRAYGWTLVVIAKNRLVFVHVSSWSMSEATVKSKIKSYWLKADVSVIILLSNSSHNIVIKLLEFDSFGYTWKQKERISNCISYKWLVNQLISNYIRISFKGPCNFLPILNEFFMKMSSWIVKLIEDISYIITEVVVSPISFITFIPIRLP